MTGARLVRLLISTAAAATLACATNPATGKRQFSLMSEAQEIAIGQENDASIRQEMGIYNDEALQQFVSSVGLRLAKVSERPGLPWHFAVVDVPVVNAFALPGGYIYMTRGILAFLNDEAQLAGVLGHEVGHVTGRHAAQQYSRATGAGLGLLLGSVLVPEVGALGGIAESSIGLLFLKYGRADELQADELGVRYASRAGWDPAGVQGMLSTLDRIAGATEEKAVPNWLATHPAPADRVERVQAAIKAASTSSAVFESNRDEYLRRIDGMIYGDNPDQGIVRGRSFVHPKLRFGIEFPEGWEITNSPRQVVGRQKGADVFLVLQLVEKPVGRNIEEIALGAMQRAGFRAISGNRVSINGLEAFLGTYQGVLEGLGSVGLRAAHLTHERQVFMFAGLAPARLYERAEPVLTASLRSFRPLPAAEAANIQPNRIDLYTAREGDTWQSIAERQGRGVVKPDTLAIMNGHRVAEPPKAGERLKIVVGG
jgi:predicted Zn-dependent protease